MQYKRVNAYLIKQKHDVSELGKIKSEYQKPKQ